MYDVDMGGCSAEGSDGGAIYSETNIVIEDSYFISNSAFGGESGGAIYLEGSATIRDTTFEENSIVTEETGYGGAIYHSDGELDISGSEFIGNYIDDEGGYSEGGAISSHGMIYITDSRFEENYVVGEGGYGAAISTSGDSRLVSTIFTENRSTYGGALDLYGDTAEIRDSVFEYNEANDYGGAISAEGDDLIITGSSFAYNEASEYGGAISADTDGIIINSTFYNNYAYTDGGAISNSGSLQLRNVTLSGNSEESNGFYSEGGLAIRNSIFDDSCTIDNGDFSPESLAFNKGGYKIDSLSPTSFDEDSTNNIESGVTCGFDDEDSMQNIDPILGEYSDNGGFTKTISLATDSPAIGAGRSCYYDSGEVLDIDQRGEKRAFSPESCDIGAYEMKSVYIGTSNGLTVELEDGTSLNIPSRNLVNGTIRAFVKDANGNVVAEVTLNLDNWKDWSSVTSGYADGKSFVHNLAGAPGVGSSFTLYVPFITGSESVTICPGADSLDDLNADCDGAYTVDEADDGVSIVEISGKTYWRVENVTGSGGFSNTALASSGYNISIILLVGVTTLLSMVLVINSRSWFPRR
jgi:predicted outer membrane repeat protein